MKVWVTKYALTIGIQCKNGAPHPIATSKFEVDGFDVLISKEDCCLTESAAKAKAEQMRVEKISSLQKQIARLEKLKF